MCLDSFYYFKDYQNLFEMRKMKDKKKYATRLDWGEIPGLFLLKKVATKLLIFVATQCIIKTVKGIRKRKGGNQNERI